MNRLFFLNRYFFPDHSATSQILSQLALHLTESGHDVHVITSRQLYDDPVARLSAEETDRGVKIHRLLGTRLGRSGLLSRSVDYFSFYISAWRLLLAVTDQDDILVTMTDPPLLSILGMHIARRRRLRVINWLQDIYPEVASELGVPFVRGPVSTLLRYARDASLRAADANVVVGNLMAEKLRQLGVASERIKVIPNWCNDETIVPVDAAGNPLRTQWQLQENFVVGYSGNLGRAHEFDTILAASEHFRNDPNIIFLFIGGGHRSDELVRRVKAQDLSHKFRFLPYQRDEDLKYSLSVPDVHWISLRPELEGLIVPSKVYGIAAAGRPIIAVTARNGEIVSLVRKYDCGVVVEPGNSDELARVIIDLSRNVTTREAMGRRARAMLEANFTRQHSFKNWTRVVDRVARSRRANT
jgi:glycosyltransferase involved in cell wall biosynthesis